MRSWRAGRAALLSWRCLSTADIVVVSETQRPRCASMATIADSPAASGDHAAEATCTDTASNSPRTRAAG